MRSRALAAFALPLLALVLLPARAQAASGPGGVDMLPILAGLVLILLGAKLCGSLFAKAGQSPALGELLLGIVLGNLGLLGYHGLESLKGIAGLEILSQLGVLFLLFQVGLHTNVKQMMAVGWSSLLVATIGVIVPMVLGYFCSRAFFPNHSVLVHWFTGATLCATSVGITARVLEDLGRTKSLEGRIILGAAVIDDVLGLIVLAVIAGTITAADQGRTFEPISVLWSTLKALVFLAGAVVVGEQVSRRAFRLAGALAGEGVLLAFALAFCFTLAWIAGRIGLAPIVGAFAAGLVLDELHTVDLKNKDPRQRGVPELLEPLASFLVPVFFVLMGMRVDLAAFGVPGVLGFAAVLTAAAVIGKQVCGLGVLERGADRLAVGLGMIPRGEVGLIFASIGATLAIGGERVIEPAQYSAIVVMVALTTLMTPPLLTWKLRRR